MDNATRSARSRNAVLEAAIAIIARDGPGRLTLDAIARESRISKGGVTHQFGTKEAVLKALIDRNIEHFAEFGRAYRTEKGAALPQPHLAVQIATLREGAATPRSLSLALFGAAAAEPSLLSATREGLNGDLETIKAEARDPDLSILRWVAAWGLNLTILLGLSPLTQEERDRLFKRLLDDEQWTTVPHTRKKPRPVGATNRPHVGRRGHLRSGA
jgi:AcrR family transcriptional regulator